MGLITGKLFNNLERRRNTFN